MKGFAELLMQPLEEFWAGFVAFIPNLMAMLVILAGGLVIAWIARVLLTKLFKVFNMDKWCDKVGITSIIRKADIWSTPSDGFISVVYWFIIIIFLMIGLSALRLQTIESLASQFFLYLPRVFSAVLIIIIGYIVAGFVSRAVLIAAVNSAVSYARTLAEATRLLIIVLTAAMSLEQLQIAPGIVVAAFSILFGGIVLAFAIAFGAGGIEIAKKVLEKRSEDRKEKPGGIDHL